MVCSVKRLANFIGLNAVRAGSLAVFLAFGVALPAWAQIVDRIEVGGNQRVEDATVQSYIPIAPGTFVTDADIDRALKALFATGLFSDVRIRREGVNLIVDVVENPVINRLAFEGNKKIRSDVLETEVQLRPRIVFTRARVQNDVQRILQVYRRSGRFAATVEPKVIQLEQNRVDLVFEINEGPVTSIQRINFIGNQVFSDRKLRSVVATRETRFYRFLTVNDTYDPDRITFDRELLRRFYLSEGYADFRVISVNADLAPDREGFYVTIAMEEGERFRVGEVAVESTVRDLTSEPLAGVVDIQSGDVYDADKIEVAVEDLSFSVGQLGYAFVDIRPRLNIDRETNLIDISFEMNEGPRVYVERVNITGNVRTLDKVVRRQFRLAEGDAFDTAKLRASRRNVRSLGFFRDVRVTQEPGSTPDRSVINVDVQEQSTGELSFGLGFSTTDGPLGDISIRERNLLGKGQDLRAGFSLSGRTQEVDLSFTEPAFLGRNIAAGFDVFRQTTDLQSESSYDSKELGFALRAGYPLTEKLRQRFTYTLREDTIENVAADVSAFIALQAGADVTSSVAHALVYDQRDDAIEPTEGYRVTVEQTLAGFGGTKRYFKNTVNYETFYPIRDDIVGSLGINQGFIVGIGKDVGIGDRFFLGGNNFRGFGPAGVGPRDKASGDALGGNVFYVGTAEVRFPIGLPPELGVSGVAFTQAGSLAKIDDPTTSPLFDVGSMRLSSGIGFAWKSPFGPFRIDYAKALRKETLDRTQNVFFSFGTRF
ncbi:MAG: outer membrane protein assembly factor BamA [Proteobacteria bacterium]|nr:outer membrane protein assembly factor BamA [Pseudomonadota bacterium]MDA1058576.1 outer membrane protein assembly factor BamA [Pseudomonadota bacterium]